LGIQQVIFNNIIRLPVDSSHGHLVTRSCHHTVNSSPINSSHTRLVTQSTRHKRADTKPPVVIFLSARRSGKTVFNTDGVITASEHTSHMQCRAVRFGYYGRPM